MSERLETIRDGWRETEMVPEASSMGGRMPQPSVPSSSRSHLRSDFTAPVLHLPNQMHKDKHLIPFTHSQTYTQGGRGGGSGRATARAVTGRCRANRCASGWSAIICSTVPTPALTGGSGGGGGGGGKF